MTLFQLIIIISLLMVIKSSVAFCNTLISSFKDILVILMLGKTWNL
jgi:hypothetical protein